MTATPEELAAVKDLNLDIETAAIYRFEDDVYRGYSNSINKVFSSYEAGLEFYRSLGYQKGKILIGEWV